MTGWETYLVVAALGAFLASLTARLFGVARDARWSRVADRGLAAGAGLLLAALGLLLLAFLRSDLRIQYVHAYTHRAYPWYYKLTGLWGGNEGTLLMWVALLAAFAWLLNRQLLRQGPPSAHPERIERLRHHLMIVLLGILGVFTGILLTAKVFALTPDYLLAVRPNGNGLQPVLLTPFMIIHPPIQFFFYALTGLIFAAGLVNVATGERLWVPVIRPWVRLTWILATFGMGLGGLWAYYVLNFGGFWAWDPVETANLLAWFPLTLLLHALIFYEKGRFQTMAPLFALLTFPTVLFATVATRTGLWVSVHAFTDPSQNFARDPFMRLLFILETGTLLQVLTAFLITSLLVALVAVGLGRVRNWPEPRRTRARQAWLGAATLLVFLLFFATVPTISAVFEVAQAITFGTSTLVGSLLLLGAVAAWLIVGGPTPEEVRRPTAGRRMGVEAAVNARNVFAAAVLLLTLAFLVTFLLNMIAVNGYARQPYDERAPWLALPILLAMGLLFLLPWLGPRRGLVAAGVALGLSLLGFWLFPDDWPLALALPALAFAAVGAFWRVLKTSRQVAPADPWARALGVLLIVGGLLGLLYWANPPSTFRFLGLSAPLAWGWAVPGFVAAFAAVLTGILLRGRSDRRLGAAGGLLLLPAFGYGLSVLAGLAVLVATARLAVRRDAVAGWVRLHRESLRRTSVYMLHLLLVLGLAGYAVATYTSEESFTTRYATDQEPGAAFGGYTFQVVETHRVDPDPVDQSPERFEVDVAIWRHGERLPDATLIFWKVPDEIPWHYDAKTTVVRYVDRDLYLFPTLLEFTGGDLPDHSEGVYPPEGHVVGVHMTIKVLPGMAPVWTGLYGITGLMLVNLSLSGFTLPRPAPAPRPADDRPGAGRVPDAIPAP